MRIDAVYATVLLRQLLLPGLLAALVASPAMAQRQDGPSPKRLRAGPRAGAIHLDGRLTDTAWARATFTSEFTQKEPVQFAEPSVRTEVAVLFDDEALYVGARLFAPDPRAVPRSLTRRDQYGNAEHLVFSIDPFEDRRTAYSFVITAGGTRIDYYHPHDSEGFGARDFTFNPVWEARVAFDSLGWTAEMRIPFSQLRFNAGDVQSWGLNINRWRPQNNEDIYWVVVPRDETGFASRFGTLEGITGIRPTRRMELMPYVASDGIIRSDVDPNDPFIDRTSVGARAGADLKMGLGPNITLDASVNPDFGQVEADPAELNLTAFETFFSERRPFFTEGSQLLQGGINSYFYSRRIGGRPRGPVAGTFVDRPENTTILGAAKVTGRLPSGLSIGALVAVTDREYARTQNSPTGPASEVEVEPLAIYGVGRLQQQFGRDASTVGVSFAGVTRSFGEDAGLEAFLSRQAVAGGVDWRLRFKGGEYEFSGSAGLSHVEGDTAAIRRIQRSPVHYYQRPDADVIRLDPTRTALNGWRASVRGDKNAGKLLWGIGLNAESPGLETNDMGRLGNADDLELNWDINYRETTPGKLFRNWRVFLFNFNGFNFDGDKTAQRVATWTNLTFLNFWGAFLGAWVHPRTMSDTQTRGGPLMQTPRSWGSDLALNSNQSNPNGWRVFGGFSKDELDGWSVSAGGGISGRPSPTLGFSIDPNVFRSVNRRQYVSTVARTGSETFGNRYIFGAIDQTVLSMRFRLNYTVTPDLTLEAYAEPFAATGKYSSLGELAAASTFDLRTYGTAGTVITPEGTSQLRVTDARDGQSFTLPVLDFQSLSFRSNLVVRWEWSPGSTLFLVWQQDRSAFCSRFSPGDCPSGVQPGDRARLGSLGDALGASGNNFLAIKASYWIPVR